MHPKYALLFDAQACVYSLHTLGSAHAAIIGGPVCTTGKQALSA